VPQVVQPQLLGQRVGSAIRIELGDGGVRGSDSRLEAVRDKLGLPQRPTTRRGEHQLLSASGAAGQVGARLLGERARQPDRPRFVGLDPAPLQMPGDLRRGHGRLS
jgi:hypothetical protein